MISSKFQPGCHFPFLSEVLCFPVPGDCWQLPSLRAPSLLLPFPWADPLIFGQWIVDKVKPMLQQFQLHLFCEGLPWLPWLDCFRSELNFWHRYPLWMQLLSSFTLSFLNILLILSYLNTLTLPLWWPSNWAAWQLQGSQGSTSCFPLSPRGLYYFQNSSFL